MEANIAILAGGVGSRLGAGVPKAWAQLNGKPLCQYILDEAEKLEPCHTFLLCHEEWFKQVPQDRNIWYVGRTGSYIGDLFAAMDAAADSDDRLLLIVHADAVLLTSEAMDQVIRMAMASDAGFIWPSIPIEECFPESGGHRYVPGTKKMARTNIIAAKPWMIKCDSKLIRTMKEHDSIGEIIAWFRVLGVCNVLKGLAGRLPVSTLCNLMGHALGCRVEIP